MSAAGQRAPFARFTLREASLGRAGGVLRAVLYPVVGLAAFVGIWWAWIAVFVDAGSFLSEFAPDRAVVALVSLIRSGDITEHVVASVRRIVVGLGLAGLVGIPLGLLLGAVRWFAAATGPLTSFIRMISPLSWTPLAIVVFGVGDPPVYFLIAVGATWPVALSTAAGVSALDPQWLLLGRSLGATRLELLRTIVWPGIKGEVLTGMRLGLSTAWIILVPAEMLGVDSGLGFFILDARDRFAYDEVVAAIIVIGAIGLVLDRIAGRVLRSRRPAAQQADRQERPHDAAPTAGPHFSI